MIKLIILILALVSLSGCIATGHDKYYDRPVFNGIILGVITSLVVAQTN